MYCQVVFATLAVIIAKDFVSAQEMIPSSTTAGELWNPWTWFWPYAKATAEAYRDYYDKAQKATNELYQQIYKTNAFPWVTGNWGPQIYPGGNDQSNGQNQNQNGQNQNNQNGQNQNNQNGQNQNNPNGQNQNNPNGQNQNNPNGQNQNNQNGQDQNNQNGQDQNNQNDQGENNQNNQDNNQADENPDNQDQQEANQSKPGAQVQGGTQEDGTADAEVNAQS